MKKQVMAVMLVGLSLVALVHAQSSGSRGGINQNYDSYQQPVASSSVQPAVDDYIQVSSQIELRVKPDQIRIVLAVAKDGPDSVACERLVFSKIGELRDALKRQGIKDEDIVDDFIAVLPRYEFDVESRNGKEVIVEKLAGYSMQSNLHIKVATDDAAMKAIRSAFQLGVTDIIGFDYWSSKLESAKEEAIELAMEKTKSKAKRLLLGTFDTMPQPINVDSSTTLHLPKSQYESFTNANSQTVNQDYAYYSQKNLPVIRASRPQNTYYRGFQDNRNDVHPTTVAMRPEISIVSSVTIFYASPVAKEYRELDALRRSATSNR